MSDITRAISIARRRLLAGRILHCAGKAMVIALPCVLALLLIDRLVGLSLPLALYVSLVCAAVVAALSIAVWRAPRAMDVCVEIDRRLQLKDRIGSAHAIANTPAVALQAFAPLVVADAQELARKIDLRHAIPIRMGSYWSLAIVYALALALTAWLVPMRQPSAGNGGGPNASAMLPAEFAAATEALDQATDDIRRSLDSDAEQNVAENPEAFNEKLDALDAIAQQLTNHDPTNPEVARARSAASASMNELAEDMAARSERELQSLDELARRFEGLNDPNSFPGAGADADPKLREFLDAMSRGEYEEAANAIEDAANNAKSLDAEARRDAAEQFRHLSEQIAKLAEQENTTGSESADESQAPAAPDATPSREEQLREALEDLGKSQEEIERLLDPKKPEHPSEAPSQDQPEQNEQSEQDKSDENQLTRDDIAKELREAGADDELAEEMSRDIEQVRKDRENAQQADEQAKDIADAIRNTADEIEQGAQNEPSPRDGEQNTTSQDGTKTGEQSTTKPDPNAPADPNKPNAPTTKPEETPTGTPTTKPTETPNGEPTPGEPTQDDPTGEPPTPTEKPEGTPTGTPKPEPGTGTRPTPGEPKPTPTPGEPGLPPGTSGPEDDPSGDGPPTPGDPIGTGSSPTPGEAPTGTATGGKPGPKPDRDAPSKIRDLETLRELARRNRELADKLKDRAREVGDTLTPEEKRNIERWNEAQRREDHSNSPGPLEPGTEDGSNTLTEPLKLDTDNDDVNLSQGDVADGTKIGEFDGDDLVANDPSNRASGARLNSAAQRNAERAIEQGEVPARYHRFIQRYFKSLSDQKNDRDDAENAVGKKS